MDGGSAGVAGAFTCPARDSRTRVRSYKMFLNTSPSLDYDLYRSFMVSKYSDVLQRVPVNEDHVGKGADLDDARWAFLVGILRAGLGEPTPKTVPAARKLL